MSSRCLCIYLNRCNQTKYNPRTFPILYNSNAENYVSPAKKKRQKNHLFFFSLNFLLPAFVEADTTKNPTLNIFAVVFVV